MARLRGWRTSAILWVGRGALWVGCCALLAAGCATSQSALQVPLPSDAQGIWGTYWTAVERGDVAEWNRLTHSSARAPSAKEFDPRVQADARSFLTLCRVQPGSMAMGGDRASFRTRCADGPTQSGLFPWGGAEIVLRKDEDGVWRFFCFGCGLPYQSQSEEAALSPYDAQRLWVAFWSAVERGDAGEVRPARPPGHGRRGPLLSLPVLGSNRGPCRDGRPGALHDALPQGRRRGADHCQRHRPGVEDPLRGQLPPMTARAAQRMPARMKLWTNWRWKSRKAMRSGPEVMRVAAVMMDQSTP